MVQRAVKKSGSGAAWQEIAYPTAGSTFVTTRLPYRTAQVGENWVLHTLDFSAAAAVNDNPDFTVRITPTGRGSEATNVEGTSGSITSASRRRPPRVRRCPDSVPFRSDRPCCRHSAIQLVD